MPIPSLAPQKNQNPFLFRNLQIMVYVLHHLLPISLIFSSIRPPLVKMLKLLSITIILSLFCFLGLTDAGQESFSVLNLCDPKTPMVLQSLSHTNVPVAVSASIEDLIDISSSVLMAESWLRTHVLTHYPATNITTIVVTNNILCNRDHKEIWGLVLPSMKNIYHSLVRWGLESEIKVSTTFSKDCLLHPFFNRFKDDLADSLIKPLLDFLHDSNSTYSVNPPPYFSPLSDKTIKLVDSHRDSMMKLGFFNVIDINVVISTDQEQKPMKRKLSSLSSSKVVDPFPARPTPLPPIHSSIGYSVPAYVTKSPPSPLMAQIPPSPSMSFSFPPESPPLVIPANPPEVYTYPPCSNPSPPTDHQAASPTPSSGGNYHQKGLWCVAKPTVPADDLQEAIDYACGDGGADCEEIKPHGSCYNPDTIVAHASYAFNSYWQKNKINGGTCSFGGTAMVINTDPSFLQCRFILSLG